MAGPSRASAPGARPSCRSAKSSEGASRPPPASSENRWRRPRAAPRSQRFSDGLLVPASRRRPPAAPPACPDRGRADLCAAAPRSSRTHRAGMVVASFATFGLAVRIPATRTSRRSRRALRQHLCKASGWWPAEGFGRPSLCCLPLRAVLRISRDCWPVRANDRQGRCRSTDLRCRPPRRCPRRPGRRVRPGHRFLGPNRRKSPARCSARRGRARQRHLVHRAHQFHPGRRSRRGLRGRE